MSGTPRQILADAVREPLADNEGKMIGLELQPGLSAAEASAFESRLPGPLPEDVRELLLLTRGFDISGLAVDFEGQMMFEYEPAFPCGLPVCHDGYGNFWVVDVNPETGGWDHVFFACHDPPVLVYQAGTLSAFLDGLLDCFRPDRESAVDYVHDLAAMRVWDQRKSLKKAGELRPEADPVMSSFTQSLQDDALVADLRQREVGNGFAWGAYGLETVVTRFGNELLFAIEKPERRGLLRLLLGPRRRG